MAFSDEFLLKYGYHFLWKQQNGWVIEGPEDLPAKNILLISPLVIFDRIAFY